MKNRAFPYLMMAWACVSAWVGDASAFPSISQVVPAAQNTTMPDEDGEYPAYIVITEPETWVFDGAWYLSSNPQNPMMWAIPQGTVVAKGMDLIIFASGKNRTQLDRELHTNFTYPCDVPFCGLYQGGKELVSQFSLEGTCFPCNGYELIHRETPVRYVVPKEGMGHEWVNLDYPDTNWARGIFGIGYDAPESLCSDMILYTTMDKDRVVITPGAGTIALDTSGSPNVHDGFVIGKPTLEQGQVLEGFEFPRDPESFIRIPHHFELNPQPTGFTAAIWVNPLEEGVNEVLVAKGGESEKEPGWMFARDGKSTFFQLAFPFQVYRINFREVPGKVWTHLCVVLDPSTSSLLAYQDGGLVDSMQIEVATAQLNERDLIVGNYIPGGRVPFGGRLDEFAIWARPLPRAEVQLVYKTGAEGLSIQTNCTGSTVPLYDPLIMTDVEGEMKGVNSSILIRVPFSIQEPALVGKLLLGMHYDDGFVMYLNGTEILRRNALSVPIPPMNAAAASNRPDPAALVPELFDLTAAVPLLRTGTNLLAIHGLNSSSNADRFLIYPRLCLEERDPVDVCTRTTDGREFWIAFPENSEDDTTNPLELAVLISGPPSITGVVEVPRAGWSASYTIGLTGTAKVQLPKQFALLGEDSIEGKAVRVTASRDVAVYGLTHIDYSTDTFLGIPVELLGNEYIAIGYKNVWSEIPVLNGSQFAIAAPYHDTVIEIDPSTKTATRPSGDPFTIVLNRGETFQLRSVEDAPSDLTGTIIRSNRPIAVFGGHQCANIRGTQFFCDQIVEQLLPVTAWGTRYNTVPLRTRTKDTIRVVASRNGTPVMVNGAMVTMLNRGGIFEFVADQPTQVLSEYPIMVAQYSNSSDYDMVEDSDPFMVMAQPASTYLNNYRFYAPPTSGFDKNFINVVVPVGEAGVVTLDGTAINAIPGAVGNPFPVGGLEGWQVPLSGAGVGHILIGGKSAVGLTIYGFASYDFDSYGNSGGMRLRDNQPPIVACPEYVAVYGTLQDPKSGECLAIMPDLIAKSGIYENCTPARAVVVTQDPPPGVLLKEGVYEVKILAIDAIGLVGECVSKLEVLGCGSGMQVDAWHVY